MAPSNRFNPFIQITGHGQCLCSRQKSKHSSCLPSSSNKNKDHRKKLDWQTINLFSFFCPFFMSFYAP